MCGIAGVIGGSQHNKSVIVERMSLAMHHRGPDQRGSWTSPCETIHLAHRRLSILDLSEAGRQPMVDPQTGVALTFNGEIYNFKILRRELESLGYQFKSATDSEVLLKSYLAWGEDFVGRLRGMFAFSIWDPRTRETILIRDKIGIKPLYYCQLTEGFVFASEVRALLASEVVERKLDRGSISNYLWQGFVPGPDTIIKGIKSLRPGFRIRLNETGAILENSPYKSLDQMFEPSSGADAVSICLGELERSISEHLASDVPLGVFLSGGVDSSVIAAIAQRASDDQINTYNISFEESRYDESKYARRVADLLGTSHTELMLTESMFQNQLGQALDSLDQPTFDAINTYFVSSSVRQSGITVALAGTGGDELFGGYASFKEMPRAKMLSNALRFLPSSAGGAMMNMAAPTVFGRIGEVRPQVRWGKIEDLLSSKGDLLSLYQVFYALFSKKFHNELLLEPSDPMGIGLSVELASSQRALLGASSMLRNVSELEMANFLTGRLLPDTDAASMAVSLEVRVPLLDHQFVESLKLLNDAQRFSPLGSKTFLRSAVAAELPSDLFDRPKAGFELPLQEWCKNQLAPEMAETFQDINLAHSIGLNAETIGRLWRAFSDDAPGLYWSRIWSIYVLMNWCRQHKVAIG